MTTLKEIYKCDICGNVVEVLHTGGGELVCCGQPMTLQQENLDDLVSEKHIPVMIDEVVSIPHPMEESHHIEWVEVLYENGSSCKKFFHFNDIPKAIFDAEEPIIEMRSYCNIHGLWTNKQQ